MKGNYMPFFKEDETKIGIGCFFVDIERAANIQKAGQIFCAHFESKIFKFGEISCL